MNQGTMNQRLKDRVALVTGGGSGIGEAICNRFAEAGAKVVVTDINLPAAERVAGEIVSAGGEAIALEQDVSCENAWQKVVAAVNTQLGGLHILVNNAGIVVVKNIEETSLEEWQLTERVNVQGVFLGIKHVLRAIDKSGGGCVINISSIDGLIGDSMAAAYNASKGAVRLMSKSAALHCAEKGYRVRVNSVHPGYIMTPLVEQAFAKMSEVEVEAYKTGKINRIPIGPMGTPDDVAYGCLYLASEEARYVTGAELVIDGGYTAA